MGVDLDREFKQLSSRLPFGLNFERHRPEAVELPQHPIRKWSYPDFADTFQPEKESVLSTPKPPYPVAFRQQMVELVRAGLGIGAPVAVL